MIEWQRNKILKNQHCRKTAVGPGAVHNIGSPLAEPWTRQCLSPVRFPRWPPVVTQGWAGDTRCKRAWGDTSCFHTQQYFKILEVRTTKSVGRRTRVSWLGVLLFTFSFFFVKNVPKCAAAKKRHTPVCASCSPPRQCPRDPSSLGSATLATLASIKCPWGHYQVTKTAVNKGEERREATYACCSDTRKTYGSGGVTPSLSIVACGREWMRKRRREGVWRVWRPQPLSAPSWHQGAAPLLTDTHAVFSNWTKRSRDWQPQSWLIKLPTPFLQTRLLGEGISMELCLAQSLQRCSSQCHLINHGYQAVIAHIVTT